MSYDDMINIRNPSLPTELLAKPMCNISNFKTFIDKSKELVSNLEKLEHSQSMIEINSILENVFDENVTGRRVVKDSISKYGHLVSKQKEASNITINKTTGTLSALGAFVSKVNSSNSFYGD